MRVCPCAHQNIGRLFNAGGYLRPEKTAPVVIVPGPSTVLFSENPSTHLSTAVRFPACGR